MNEWIKIWKYLQRTKCQNRWPGSFSKFTFEFGGANWVLPLDQAKDKAWGYLKSSHWAWQYQFAKKIQGSF